MIIIGIVLILIVVCLYILSIKPNKNRKEKMEEFESHYIAHRGLFDNESEAPENSLKAFEKAVAHGFGIELDVQMTTDGQLVVFHDKTLTRMCQVKKTLTKCSFDELSDYHLAQSQEKIPLFEDVLKVIGGKVPLIVEIKSEGDWKNTTQKMAEMMDGYEGTYCMESFHPLAVKWFKDHRPEIIRGQLSTNFFKNGSKKKWHEKFVFTNLMLNFLTKPDFIAYDHKRKNDFSYWLCRKLFQVENVAWTIRNPEELKEAEKTFDVIIFDSFLPSRSD